jgi:hypothetical protein
MLMKHSAVTGIAGISTPGNDWLQAAIYPLTIIRALFMEDVIFSLPLSGGQGNIKTSRRFG